MKKTIAVILILIMMACSSADYVVSWQAVSDEGIIGTYLDTVEAGNKDEAVGKAVYNFYDYMASDSVMFYLIFKPTAEKK